MEAQLNNEPMHSHNTWSKKKHTSNSYMFTVLDDNDGNKFQWSSDIEKAHETNSGVYINSTLWEYTLICMSSIKYCICY